ncbi:hypothetical protein KC19_2G029600 [Ceratodon purpureus]|uniref:Uncharacterized protein n=1 Tax=Ceratodon purpureus TaxID=3225 RepID=A0A8T0IRL5_CERPU|nr:hypothetical protein KC19_2G029600 [Ceratodon purpureus]
MICRVSWPVEPHVMSMLRLWNKRKMQTTMPKLRPRNRHLPKKLLVLLLPKRRKPRGQQQLQFQLQLHLMKLWAMETMILMTSWTRKTTRIRICML